MVDTKPVAENLGQVRFHRRSVEQVHERLPPGQRVQKPVSGLIRRHIARDPFIERGIQARDCAGGQRIRHHQVALQVEQVSLLIGHPHPSPCTALRRHPAEPRALHSIIRPTNTSSTGPGSSDSPLKFDSGGGPL